MLADLVLTVIVVCLDNFDEFREVGAVTGIDLCQCNGGAGLAANQCSQARLALDNAVWDTHFAAQSWQEQDNLNEGKQKNAQILVQC